MDLTRAGADPDSAHAKEAVQWNITRLRAKAEFLGYVEAPDEKAAIQAAIEQFEITNPQHQTRLVAQRRS
jgi:Ser/Thr protein kinase RdoA (MazF antagonist)